LLRSTLNKVGKIKLGYTPCSIKLSLAFLPASSVSFSASSQISCPAPCSFPFFFSLPVFGHSLLLFFLLSFFHQALAFLFAQSLADNFRNNPDTMNIFYIIYRPA
jgi:hypothetical protein